MIDLILIDWFDLIGYREKKEREIDWNAFDIDWIKSDEIDVDLIAFYLMGHLILVNWNLKPNQNRRNLIGWLETGWSCQSYMLVSKIKPCMSKYEQLVFVKLRRAH